MVNFIIQALLSLAIGAVIGVERENTGKSALGIRSFSIICFLGLLVSIITDSPLFVLIALSGVFVFAGIYYFRVAKGSQLSLSTALMIPFTFILGVLVSKGLTLEAGASGILVAFILSQKDKLHKIIESLSKQELTDGLIFCIAAIVVYPFIPSQPLNVFSLQFNLQQAWLVVVLVMFLSFFSHMLIKYNKGRGAIYSAFLASWVSSLIYLSLITKKLDPSDSHSFKLYFLISTLGMLIRNAFLVLVLAPGSFKILLPLLFPIAGCVIWILFSLNKKQLSLKPLEPEFSIWYAIKFSFFFTLVSVIVLAALSYNNWVYLAFFGSGILSSASGFALLSSQFSSISFATALYSAAFIVAGDLFVVTFILLTKLKKDKFKSVLLPSLVLLALSFLGVLLLIG